MTEQMKQILEKDKNQLYADDYCYIDLSDYGIDFSDRSNRWIGNRLEEAAKHFFDKGADNYRNNVWHPASEKPAGVDDAGRDIHIVTMEPEYYGNKLQTWHIFSYMSWDWVKAHAGEFDKWAYLEDLLPDKYNK